MKCKTRTLEYLSFFLLMAALTASGTGVSAKARHQAQAEATAKPIVTTTINKKPPASGITISSGTTIHSVKGTTVVNLDTLGRFEVLRNSRITVSFNDVSITGSLYAGSVRIATAAGVSANISTRNGEVVVANNNAATSFTIDTECGNTFVTVKTGFVELRANDEVKKIASGSQDSVGMPEAGCKRKSAP